MAETVYNPFTIDNEVFAAFLFYGGIVLLKLLAMSPITIMYRLVNNSFMNMEDTTLPVVGEKDPEKRKRALVPSEAVNRIKRAHANDIENIVPFAIISLVYIAIGPDVATAILMFKVFAYARIVHTIIYIFAVPQPCRLLAFLVGFFVNVYMAMEIVKKVF